MQLAPAALRPRKALEATAAAAGDAWWKIAYRIFPKMLILISSEFEKPDAARPPASGRRRH
jgi:hypothetical protein